LVFPMRFFYWDKIDYQQRVCNLLIIALIFTAVVLIRRLRLAHKCLHFFNRLTMKKRLALIFVTAEILFIIASLVIIEKGVLLGGDEPHYLVISHSIAKDGDLNVFNQYAREEYLQFVDTRLNHHARVGKGFKVWYSYGHLPGLSLTTAPFFLLKLPNPLLYFLIRAYLGLFGSLTAVLVYLFALRLWRNKSLALWVCATYTLSAPVFFYAVHIFAELQAALLILSALYLLFYAQFPKSRSGRILIAGLLLSISVFWGLKYAVFIALMGAGFFVYYFFKKQPKQALLIAIFPALIGSLFLGYLYYAYGNFKPMSIYNGVMTPEQEHAYQSGMESIPMQKRVETFMGIFADQRDGLLLYSPLYFFALPGLILAIGRYRKYWAHLLIALTGFAYILFISFSTVRAGYCPQARYLMPTSWLLMMLVIIYYRETSNGLMKKIILYLPLYGLLVVGYQMFHPFTLYQSVTHNSLNRPGLMFQQWGNLYMNLADLLPSFVKVPGNVSYLPNIIFLLLVLGLLFFALKQNIRRPGRFVSRTAFGLVFFGLFVSFALFPKIPDYNPVLLKKDEPCKIYGESLYPTRKNEWKSELKETTDHTVTLSTVKPAAYLVMDLENNGTAVHTVSISNFDQHMQTVEVQPGSVKKVYLTAPRYKRHQNQLFYRLHMQISPETSSRPEFYMQVYPASSTDFAGQ